MIVRTYEVTVAVHGAVVLAPSRLVPFDTDPQLSTALGLALVLQLPEIPDSPAAVVEEHLPANELFLVL